MKFKLSFCKVNSFKISGNKKNKYILDDNFKKGTLDKKIITK